SGFGIQDSGFGIRDSGFGIRDSGFGIRDSGFGIRDSGFGIRDSLLLCLLKDKLSQYFYALPLLNEQLSIPIVKVSHISKKNRFHKNKKAWSTATKPFD
ncbi:hypothetical protein, partial [Vibrio campbellii]|uniref:hypothetical protein n=1 Tax=Vibrio campbellii TaxID=680 RepID=UPI003908E889